MKALFGGMQKTVRVSGISMWALVLPNYSVFYSVFREQMARS